MIPAGLGVTSTLRIRQQDSREGGIQTPNLSSTSILKEGNTAREKSDPIAESDLNKELLTVKPLESHEAIQLSNEN